MISLNHVDPLRLSCLLLFTTLGILPARSARSEGSGTYGPPRQIAKLSNREISESSGLAQSRRRPGLFWTHNDSGDIARLFAFETNGKHLGACTLQGAEAIDWEDMASFERNGRSWLLLADVGDNGLRRNSYQLYLCEEPLHSDTAVQSRRIEFRYDRGSHNCEAVAVDAEHGVILLVTKVTGPVCQVFQLAIPEKPGEETMVAELIATISVPVAVAMDISPDGLRAIVLTYGDAFEYSRGPDEDWRLAFARIPRQIAMPARAKGESICYGRDGRSLYLTSEAKSTPLWEVPWVIRR
jgi:hypothetical protein